MFSKEDRLRRQLQRSLNYKLAKLFRRSDFLFGSWQLSDEAESWDRFSRGGREAIREIQIDNKSYWVSAVFEKQDNLEVMWNMIFCWFLLPFMKKQLTGRVLRFYISGFDLFNPPLRAPRETLRYAQLDPSMVKRLSQG